MDLLCPHERHRRPRIPVPATAVLALPGPAAARDWLDIERTNLLAIATQVTPGGAAIGAFSATLHRHLAVTGRYPDGQMLHQQAVTAAARSGDHAGEAAALLNLGELDVRTGNTRTRSITRCGHWRSPMGSRPSRPPVTTDELIARRGRDVCRLSRPRFSRASHNGETRCEWWADSGGGSIRLDEFGEYLGGFLPVVYLTGSVVDFGSHCGEIVRV
jgi:hypothetical protein